MLSSYRIATFTVCLAAIPLAFADANDWGQWMGKNRDGVYHESGIIDSIPESGLQVKWRMPVGAGYAGPAVADGKVYGADQDMGSLIAADGKDGNRLWSTFDATNPSEDRKLPHGTAFVTRIGDTNRYFIMSEVGDLLISELTREKYTPHGRFHVLEPTGKTFGRSFVWSHPAYANKTAYIRNDEEIVAVDLSK